jgi:hypothetical protein
MSRSRYHGGHRGFSRSYRSRSYGRERALEHIAAAKRLSAELGGMDQGVKAYFFSLSPLELSSVLDDYQRAYGTQAREYAADTIPKWRTSRVQMSGMVAERLFNLLPPRMPLGVKYTLVEGLWHHVGPSSKYRIRVGIDADVAQVIEVAKSKVTEFVVNYKIPENIERRFDWLSAGDVPIKQMLLSHIQEMEKTVVVETVRAQVPVMLEHLHSAGSQTGRLAQIVRVGKHELELLMDKTATGVKIEDPARCVSTRAGSSSGTYAGLIWVALIIAFIICLIVLQSHR